MLKYLIAVTDSTVILAVLLGLLYAWVTGVYRRRGALPGLLLRARRPSSCVRDALRAGRLERPYAPV